MPRSLRPRNPQPTPDSQPLSQSQSQPPPQGSKQFTPSRHPGRSRRRKRPLVLDSDDEEEQEAEPRRRTPTPKNNARKRRKRAPRWFDIKGILEEKVINGQLAWLVDWANDPETGESYPPSWTVDVREDVVLAWKANQNLLKNGNASEEASEEAPGSAPEEVSEAAPVTPSRTGSQSQDQVSSQANSPTAISETHTEVGSLLSLVSYDLDPRPKISVEIVKTSEFDASEFLSVSNTQTTQNNSQPISELEEEDNRVAFASQVQHDAIPDSQASSEVWSPISEESSDPAPVESASSPSSALSSQKVQGQEERESQEEPVPRGSISAPSPEERLSTSEPVTEANTFEEPEEEVVIPDSLEVDSEIPSRQPEQLQQPENEPAHHSSSCPQQESSSSYPEFLTQPPPSFDLPIPQSSVDTRVLETSSLSNAERGSGPEQSRVAENEAESALRQTQYSSAVEAQSQEERHAADHNHHSSGLQVQKSTKELNVPADLSTEHSEDHVPNPEGALEDLDESQAAQIVPHHFEISPEQVTDSNDTRVTSHISPARSSAGDKAPSRSPSPFMKSDEKVGPARASPEDSAAAPSQSPPRVELRISDAQFDSILLRLSGGPDSQTVHNELDTTATMDQSRSPAADDLKKMFDLNSISQEEVAASTSPQPAAIIQDVTIRSPDMSVRSQPLFQSEQWHSQLQSEPFVQPQSVSPASIMRNPLPLGEQDLGELPFGQSSRSIASGLIHESDSHVQATVSPAEIINSIDPVATSLVPLTDPEEPPSAIEGSTGQSITMGQISNDHEYDESSSDTPQDTVPRDHLITLPFQSSRRPFYDDIIREYRRDAKEFGRFFSTETTQEPDQTLVSKVDELFSRLFNVCDYPQDIIGTELEKLPAADLARYCCDANPKFNFVFEFLQSLKGARKVLIIARTPELLRLLYTLTEALEVECISESIGKLESVFDDSDVGVSLALPADELDLSKYDIIIGFDHLFSSSWASKQLQVEERGPELVLQLVLTHSIEHLSLRLPQDLSHLERKHALLLGLSKAGPLLEYPSPSDYPHDAAEIFTNYLNGYTETVLWEPQTIPDSVLAFFADTQPQSPLPADDGTGQGNGLKRKLSDDDPDGEDAKRLRVLPFKKPETEKNEPPLPYAIGELLKLGEHKQPATSEREGRVEVSLAVLQGIAEKFAEVQRKSEANDIEAGYNKSTIDRLEAQLKDYQRTANKIAESHRQALEDRSKFQADALKAQDSAQAAADSAQKESQKLQHRISDLEARLSELTAVPEGSDGNPLATMEKNLHEAREKVEKLERRLDNSHNDGEYVRNLYQDVNTKAGALAAENSELQERVQELEKSASENLLKIHRTQAENAVKAHLGTISDLKIRVRELEAELDRARDELRHYKNGRPQTRQTSVPRSPRMSMMSPRPGRGVSGSASRGTSPAAAPGYEGNGLGGHAGMQFMGQQPGNSRWGHLTE